MIEPKRDEDGSHAEAQALRHAAMVSAMSFELVVATRARLLDPAQPDLDRARREIQEFLGWDEPDAERFATDTRILLVAADFGRELTMTVLWLRERDVDIRCIRLRPYRVPGGQLLVDVQPIIPLPETEDFLVRLEERSAVERQRERGEREQLAGRFLTALVRRANELGYTAHEGGTPHPRLAHWSRAFARSGLALNVVTPRTESRVELLLQGEKARERLAWLQGRREEIERRFGGPCSGAAGRGRNSAACGSLFPAATDPPRASGPRSNRA